MEEKINQKYRKTREDFAAEGYECSSLEKTEDGIEFKIYSNTEHYIDKEEIKKILSHLKNNDFKFEAGVRYDSEKDQLCIEVFEIKLKEEND